MCRFRVWALPVGIGKRDYSSLHSLLLCSRVVLFLLLLGRLIRLEDPNAFWLLARPLIPFLRQPLDCMITLSSYPILSYPILSYYTTDYVRAAQWDGMGWDTTFLQSSSSSSSSSLIDLISLRVAQCFLYISSFFRLPCCHLPFLPCFLLFPSLSDVLSLFLFLLFSWQRHQWHRYRSAESRHRPVSSTSR